VAGAMDGSGLANKRDPLAMLLARRVDALHGGELQAPSSAELKRALKAARRFRAIRKARVKERTASESPSTSVSTAPADRSGGPVKVTINAKRKRQAWLKGDPVSPGFSWFRRSRLRGIHLRVSDNDGS